MNIVFNIVMFCTVLFIYLHVHYHLKTSNDLDVYEIDLPTKTKLEEICDLRQPIIFKFDADSIIDTFQCNRVLDTYGAFDVKIRNVKDNTDDSEMYIPLAFISAIKVIKEDTNASYISENNIEFIEETGLSKKFAHNDEFLRPPMVSNCMYDFIFASNCCKTPFRYDVNYRNYYLVTEGEVTIKLTPPKSTKYLCSKNDYDNFEFRSNVNPWQVQEQYKVDFNKIKCLEVTLTKGNIIFIPAFWWHSMSFSRNTSLCSFKYRTYMNNVAIIPRIVMRFLQRQNVKRIIASNASDIKVDVLTTSDNIDKKID